jgi:hypothetical protein
MVRRGRWSKGRPGPAPCRAWRGRTPPSSAGPAWPSTKDGVKRVPGSGTVAPVPGQPKLRRSRRSCPPNGGRAWWPAQGRGWARRIAFILVTLVQLSKKNTGSTFSLGHKDKLWSEENDSRLPLV